MGFNKKTGKNRLDKHVPFSPVSHRLFSLYFVPFSVSTGNFQASVPSGSGSGSALRAPLPSPAFRPASLTT